MSDYSFKAVLVDYDEDLFSPRGWEGSMLAQAGIAWEMGQHRTPDTAQAAAQDADVVMVQSVRPLLTRSTIEELVKCQCIVRLGIGFDSVDVEAATAHGILVCNVPTYCVEDVAEHTLALLFDSVRHVARQDRWIRAGRWDRRGRNRARQPFPLRPPLPSPGVRGRAHHRRGLLPPRSLARSLAWLKMPAPRRRGRPRSEGGSYRASGAP